MIERLKLKRGLADISPLFSKATTLQAPLRIETFEKNTLPRPIGLTPQLCFIWSEDDESDAQFLNNFFASKMVAPDSKALLITFEENELTSPDVVRHETGSRLLQRLALPPLRAGEAFLGSSWVSESIRDKVGEQIYLEMNMNLLQKHSELVRALDHIVFFLKPQVESVTETYRRLKQLAALGLRAEVTLLFDADDAGGLPARLYELFSDFVSRRLSLAMNYLGTLHLSRGGEGLSQDICWESWCSARIPQSESIEKMRFLAWLEKLNQEEARV